MWRSRKISQLAILALVPMGPHMFRAFWSVLSIFLIESKTFSLFEFGFILAIESLPSLFIPIVIGSRVSSIHDANIITRRLLALSSLSLILLWISIHYRKAYLFIFSIVSFGTFSCSLTPLQRVLLKHQFYDRPALAAGLFTSAANISKIVAKLLVVPTVHFLGGFSNAISVPIVANCAITILVILCFDESCNDNDGDGKQDENITEPISIHISDHTDYESIEHSHASRLSFCEEILFIIESVRLLPIISLVLIYVHTLYIVIFHILINFIPYMAVHIWSFTAKEASFLASIPSFLAVPLCPLVGVVVTNPKTKKIHCFAAGTLAVIAYLCMIINQKSVIVALLLFSIAQSVLFTILLALIAINTPVELVGSAFGFIEVLNAISSIFGNLIFGSLCNLQSDCSYSLRFSFSISLLGCLTLGIFAWTELRENCFVPANQQYQQISL